MDGRGRHDVSDRLGCSLIIPCGITLNTPDRRDAGRRSYGHKWDLGKSLCQDNPQLTVSISVEEDAGSGKAVRVTGGGFVDSLPGRITRWQYGSLMTFEKRNLVRDSEGTCFDFPSR